MSKKFRITVNGESYEVEVEDLGGEAPVMRRQAAPVAAAPAPVAPAVSIPQPKAQPVAAAPAAPAAAKPAAGGQGSVTAPMPGTVLDVKVKEGDQVKAGQTVLILEAMKMENEIAAPVAGTIKSINVAKGAAVNPGDVLVTIG